MRTFDVKNERISGPYIRDSRLFILLWVWCFSGCTHFRMQPTAADNQILLAGTWEVIHITNSPVAIHPRCDSLRPGAAFKFSRSKLEVFPQVSGSPCDVFIFKLAGTTLTLIKGDMQFLCTYELSPGTLILKSKNFFTPTVPAKARLPNASYMQATEVVLTLKKNTQNSLP